MLQPARIALFAASALFFAGFVASFLFGGWPFTRTDVAPVALGFIFAAALVWVGAYLGARITAPKNRTLRLARVLTLLYGIIGVALTLPIKTHAVLVDMPTADGASSGYFSPRTVSTAASAAIVLISFIVVPALGMICRHRAARDA